MSQSTIPYNDRRESYQASAGQIEFYFDFPLARPLDLSVTRQRDGKLEPFSQDRDYIVLASGTTGGTIRLSEGAQDGDQIEIFGDRNVERSASFVARGDFSAKAVNDEFNNIYIILQELKQAHEGLLSDPVNNTPLPSADGFSLLAQDAQGRTISLDISALQGEQGPQGIPGPIGPRGEIPSVIAESDNGALIGVVSGGVVGEDSHNVSGDIFSLAAAPGVMGFDENKKPKLFGYSDFKGEQGSPGVQGPIGLTGPRGEIPSVIAEAENGAIVSVVSGGVVGDEDLINGTGTVFSSVSAQNVSFTPFGTVQSVNLQKALEELSLEKAGRTDAVSGGIVGEDQQSVRSAVKKDQDSFVSQTSNTSKIIISGGTI